MANIADRNKQIIESLTGRISSLSKKPIRASLPKDVSTNIDKLFMTTSYGLREIALTCLVAWEIGITFNPTDDDFYACNPRAIFESGIRHAMDNHRLPRKKSGPLNMAKGTKRLNEQWADGRRAKDRNSALALIEILRWAQQGTSKEKMEKRKALLDSILLKLLEESKRLKALAVAPRTDLTLQQTTKLLIDFIRLEPDAGNTPQKVVELIINKMHERSGHSVFAGGEACETNLTAKKPSDVWIEDPEGNITHLYEITVKPIDFNRIQDSATSVITHGKGFNEVIWQCRIPEDIESLPLDEGGTYEHDGIRFEFVPLFTWISMALEIIGAGGRGEVLKTLGDYVSLPSTSERAKIAWKKITETYEK